MFISNPMYRRMLQIMISLFMVYILWLAIPTVSEWVVQAKSMSRVEIEYYLKDVFLVVIGFLALTSIIYSIITALVKQRLSFFFFFYGQMIFMPAIITASVSNSYPVIIAIVVMACLFMVIKRYDEHHQAKVSQLQVEPAPIDKAIMAKPIGEESTKQEHE